MHRKGEESRKRMKVTEFNNYQELLSIDSNLIRVSQYASWLQIGTLLEETQKPFSYMWPNPKKTSQPCLMYFHGIRQSIMDLEVGYD